MVASLTENGTSSTLARVLANSVFPARDKLPIEQAETENSPDPVGPLNEHEGVSGCFANTPARDAYSTSTLLFSKSGMGVEILNGADSTAGYNDLRDPVVDSMKSQLGRDRSLRESETRTVVHGSRHMGRVIVHCLHVRMNTIVMVKYPSAYPRPLDGPMFSHAEEDNTYATERTFFAFS